MFLFACSSSDHHVSIIILDMKDKFTKAKLLLHIVRIKVQAHVHQNAVPSQEYHTEVTHLFPETPMGTLVAESTSCFIHQYLQTGRKDI